MTDELSIEGQGLGETEASEVEKALSLEEEVTKAYDEISLREADEESVEPAEDIEAKEPEAVEEEEKTEKPERKKRRTTHEMSPAVDPPNDWSAEEKEEFNKLPPVGKQAIARIAADFQSYRSKQITLDKQREKEYNQHFSRVKGIVEATERWLPIWGAAGRDPVSATSEILAFADKVRTNPDQALEDLARSAGRQITIHNRQGAGNTVAAQPQVSYDEIYGRVKEDLTREQQQWAYNSQFEQLKTQAIQTLEKLKSETDGNGKYLYPDLHSAEFHQHMEPIAGAIARANPSLSQEEIILRSYKAANGRVLPKKAAPLAANLSNGYSRTNLAKRAASSVPGSVGISNNPELQARKGETLEQHIARIYQELDSR